MKKYFFLPLVLFSLSVWAQMGGVPPHQGVETGLIEGQLSELHEGGKKTPFANHTVVIMVFKDGQRILMLDKETDAKGHFTFKNIFTDSAYVYAIGSMIENNVYVMSDLHLKPGEKSLAVDFPIGPGSPYFMQEMSQGTAPADQGMVPSAEAVEPPSSSPSLLDKPYQKAAVALSFLVVLLAISFSRPKKQA